MSVRDCSSASSRGKDSLRKRASCPLVASNDMQLGLVTVLLALHVAMAWLAECDNVAQLSDLKGEIYAIGNANASQPCGWHIYPDRRLQRMKFWVNESRLQGSDKLAFYSHKLQHPDAMIGIFSVARPVPVEMELRGTADMAQSSWLAAVQWWLRATLCARKESPRRLAGSRGDALSQR